jgi:alpha-galactosidase
MPRIVLIGAGSTVFTRNLCSDILLAPSLQESTIVLMDIDADRLTQARDVVQAIADGRGLHPTIEATTDQREAVRAADYVITTFQIGGLDAYTHDIEIPLRYGVGQCIGDTLGPGGVFRALRTIPVILDLCRDLDDVAPDALLLNYVNPMAMVCWAVARGTGRPHVGLCHSVQGTAAMLAGWLDVPPDDLVYRCAGINHLAFYLSLSHDGTDLYPRLRETVERPEIASQEPVRIDLFRHFGSFVTESSPHASEYVPYFRKTEALVEETLVNRMDPNRYPRGWSVGRSAGPLRYIQSHPDWKAGVPADIPDERTHEYGSYIIEAIETGQPFVLNGNVPNHGLISNLPAGACVEVPCLVDDNGIQPTTVGSLPPQLAALMRSNIAVQELTVEAALTGNREAVHHAVTLDPLTAAVCTLPQIHDMVEEMLAAEAAWLPQLC